jgi:ABC-2 type transport system permease protein
MVFPADLAIDGIVRVNQLGARLWDVAHDWGVLWLLAVVYFALAGTSAALVQRRQKNA